MALLLPEHADSLLQVVLDTLEYGSKIKKTPVVVSNCTGRSGATSVLPVSCLQLHHADRSWSLLSCNISKRHSCLLC